MRLILPLVFIGVPLAEIALLIKIGEVIGIVATVALVVATAVIGLALIRRQGVSVLTRAQQTVEAGQVPVDAVLDGVCLLLAGAFLLTPGLITDTVGFLLLMPAFRRWLAASALGWITRSRRADMDGRGDGGRGPSHGPTVIEGEFERLDPNRDGKDGRGEEAPPKPQPGGRSGWRIDS